MGIRENIENIEREIDRICAAKEMDRAGILLVAVTKTVDVEKIREAVECGISVLGENKVQEITDKFGRIDENVQWHMIGHLQKNKVKHIIDKVHMIHSLDSLGLAQEIEKRAQAANIQMSCLVQVNIGQEESKFGIGFEEVEMFLYEMLKFNHIRICGLMAIAPYHEETEKVRPYFKQMKKLFDQLKAGDFEKQMIHLSMGMTHDYKVAVEEGATIIRIGTGIFGERDYSKKGGTFNG